jgi:hypothetical protein
MLSFLPRLQPALSGLRHLSLVGAICALPAAAFATEPVTTQSADGYSVDLPTVFEELPSGEFSLSYGLTTLPDGSDGGTMFGMGMASPDDIAQMMDEMGMEGGDIGAPLSVVYNDLAFTQRSLTVQLPFGTMIGNILIADQPRADGNALRVVLVHLNIDQALMDTRNTQILGSIRRMEGAEEAEMEMAFWVEIRSSSNRADYEAYLEAYPEGRYAALARNNIRRLERLGQWFCPSARPANRTGCCKYHAVCKRRIDTRLTVSRNPPTLDDVAMRTSPV